MERVFFHGGAPNANECQLPHCNGSPRKWKPWKPGSISAAVPSVGVKEGITDPLPLPLAPLKDFCLLFHIRSVPSRIKLGILAGHSPFPTVSAAFGHGQDQVKLGSFRSSRCEGWPQGGWPEFALTQQSEKLGPGVDFNELWGYGCHTASPSIQHVVILYTLFILNKLACLPFTVHNVPSLISLTVCHARNTLLTYT